LSTLNLDRNRRTCRFTECPRRRCWTWGARIAKSL
jgi:hypothetical protein